MASTETLLSAEEYRLLPDNGAPTELVRGKLVPMNMPAPRHGEICGNVVFLLRLFLEDKDLGRVVSNDSGVVTEHDPDTVRGPDVAYYSFARVPRGPLPEGYLSVAPEIVFEVRSPGDRWRDILAKVSEYLAASVLRVCVLDPQRQTVTVYSPEEPEVTLTRDQSLTLPEFLPDFSVAVERFFA
jgi:Uma2 family endonuclease